MEERLIDSKSFKDMCDTEVILGFTPGENLTFRNYREILTFDKNEEPVTFITNIFDLSTEDVIRIYKHRWEIEFFFKWIKQNL